MATKDNINFLIIPHTGKKKARGESNFILMEDMARVFIENGDFVYFCVPEWTPDEDVRLPKDRCKVIKIPYLGVYYVDMALIGEYIIRNFARHISYSPIDVVITSKPFLVPFLSACLGDVRSGVVPILYFEPGVRDKFTGLRMKKGKFNPFHFMVASAYATGYPIFLTETEREIAVEYIQRYFTPSMIRDCLLEKSIVLPVGVPIDLLEKHKNVPKNEEFTLFFGGRANDVKRIKDIVKLYNMFYSSGRKVKIEICTSTPESLAKRYIGVEQLIKNKNISIHYDMDRDSYLKIASKAHVFVAWSKREGFPVGLWEQMYLDIVGVFVDEQWTWGNIPRDYPFVFKSIDEAYAILSYIYDNFEEARKKVSFMVDKAKSYDKNFIYNKIRDMALGIKNEYKITSGIKKLINDCLSSLGNEFTFTSLLNSMEKKGCVFFASLDKRSKVYMYPSNYDIYRYLKDIGFDYDIKFGEPDEIVFRKNNGN